MDECAPIVLRLYVLYNVRKMIIYVTMQIYKCLTTWKVNLKACVIWLKVSCHWLLLM